MNVKLNFTLIAFVGLALPALAQIDGAQFAANLRTRYGPPLPRETFTVRPGIEMIVDYATNGHVCKIQLPPTGPSRNPSVANKQAIDEATVELAPMSLRGKEVRRLKEAMGAISLSMIEYENVTIAEAFQAGRRTGVTVSFKDEACRVQPIQ